MHAITKSENAGGCTFLGRLIFTLSREVCVCSAECELVDPVNTKKKHLAKI